MSSIMDPKLPAAASILVATLEKIRNKCRPGYMVSKFVVDWISEATAIAQAIDASIASTPSQGADALDARRLDGLEKNGIAIERDIEGEWGTVQYRRYGNPIRGPERMTLRDAIDAGLAAIASTEGEKSETFVHQPTMHEYMRDNPPPSINDDATDRMLDAADERRKRHD